MSNFTLIQNIILNSKATYDGGNYLYFLIFQGLGKVVEHSNLTLINNKINSSYSGEEGGLNLSLYYVFCKVSLLFYFSLMFIRKIIKFTILHLIWEVS